MRKSIVVLCCAVSSTAAVVTVPIDSPEHCSIPVQFNECIPVFSSFLLTFLNVCFVAQCRRRRAGLVVQPPNLRQLQRRVRQFGFVGEEQPSRRAVEGSAGQDSVQVRAAAAAKSVFAATRTDVSFLYGYRWRSLFAVHACPCRSGLEAHDKYY